MRWFRKRQRQTPPLRQAALDALDESIAAAERVEVEGVDGPSFAAFRQAQHESLEALDAWVKAGMP